jgi:catechol 2,3-dioxygenase-like lactoylglutathione lyase family enzyme
MFYPNGYWGKSNNMKNPKTVLPVLQLRLALTAADFERSLKFYRDGLGLEVAADWSVDGRQAVMLEMGRASFEIFNEAQAALVDEVETGERLSGQIRLALQVPDLDAAVKRLLAHGAVLVHPPVVTPWGDKNARVKDPDGLQVTLFEVKEDRINTL